jgi:UDP-glucuronate decarboxylase
MIDSRANSIVEEDVETIVQSPLPWDLLNDATVLVTGGAGFIASYIVETLLFLNRRVLEKPARVLLLARNAYRARARFPTDLDQARLEIIEQDVCQPLEFRSTIDYVIHAASPAQPAKYLADPVGTLGANVLGTHQLLTAARLSSVKGFLFFSSGAVYGDIAGRTEPVAEHDMGVLDPGDARACYAESKRMGETMCTSWARQFGLPTRIVRPWHTYGPGLRLDDGRVFADFVRDILRGGPIVVHGDGNVSRCFCYLGDATLGFFTVLLKGSDGEAYNVSNPTGESAIGELADRLATLYRDEGVTVQRRQRSSPGKPVVRVRPNTTKLEELGWIPKWSIEAGFQRTIQSYRSAPRRPEYR